MSSAVENILEFLSFSQQLKKQERTIKLSWNRQESVSDHSWHLALFVLLVEPHITQKIDLLKAMKMALVHDLVEAEIGDVPYGESEKCRKIKEEKKHKENLAAQKIRDLAGGNLGDHIFDLWKEFEKKETSEAKLVKALDSLEANYQSILFDVSYWDNDFYKIALTKADKHCSHEKILDGLNREITSRMEKEFIKAGLDLGKIKSGHYRNRDEQADENNNV